MSTELENSTKTTFANGSRKTAILVLSLDQTLAAEVLGKLPREQVERIAIAIANTENVTREEQETVLTEFKTAFNSRPLMHPSGPNAARELLERTLDQDDVEPARQRIEDEAKSGPFAFLIDRHSDDIRRLIETEHPQTIALIAAQLPPPLAAEVLAGFTADIQADILARLARLGPTDNDVLDEIAELLKQQIGRNPVRTGGVSRAANVLRESTRSASRSVLQSLGQKDSSLAETLRGSLFSFNDLGSLDDLTLKRVLQETDHIAWAVALKGCPELLRQRVFASLSPSIARALKDELNSVGPIRLSEIQAVQQQICEAILTLESNNLIDVPRGSEKFRKTAAG